jgi:hypothetical protein
VTAQLRSLRTNLRNWAMRAVPIIRVSSTAPTAAISRATASGVLPVIHKKEISVLRVFCIRNTISKMVSKAAAMRAAQALPARVRGTRPDELT